MSYTTIKFLWPNEKYEDGVELQNAWGSAPVVWCCLCKKYFNQEFWNPTLSKKLWLMAEDPKIPEYERVMVLITCDRAYVLKRDYKRAAKDIYKFLSVFPPNAEEVNHWTEIAKLFEEDRDIPAIGFWMTSVSDDPFDVNWDENKEENILLNWDECFNIYDVIDNTSVEKL